MSKPSLQQLALVISADMLSYSSDLENAVIWVTKSV